MLVFVLPPSAEVLLERLRAQEDGGPRVAGAAHDERARGAARAEEYQYVVVNDDLERAVARVSAIIDAEASRRERVHGLEEQVRSIVERLEQEVATHSSTE